jgi:hypothetical protein
VRQGGDDVRRALAARAVALVKKRLTFDAKVFFTQSLS